MKKLIAISILLLSGITFAQANFDDHYFIDDLNLIFKPQLNYFSSTHNSDFLDRPLYDAKILKIQYR